MSDSVLDWMKKHLPPEQWTRENYLELAYWERNVELDAEGESMLPEEFQLPEYRSGYIDGDEPPDKVVDLTEGKSRKGEQGR
jgi:hypothetical protein